jgi:hypothetical protein
MMALFDRSPLVGRSVLVYRLRQNSPKIMHYIQRRQLFRSHPPTICSPSDRRTDSLSRRVVFLRRTNESGLCLLFRKETTIQCCLCEHDRLLDTTLESLGSVRNDRSKPQSSPMVSSTKEAAWNTASRSNVSDSLRAFRYRLHTQIGVESFPSLDDEGLQQLHLFCRCRSPRRPFPCKH